MIEVSESPSANADISTGKADDLRSPIAGNEKVILNVPMPHSAVFYVLGFAIEVITNEKAVLAILDECWGSFRQLHDNPALQVRIEVREGGSPECPPAPVIRQQRNLFTVVADAHNHAVCDLTHSFSLVWLSKAALQYHKYLAYHFFETAACILITTSYTTAIHAACVSRYGHGILLSADSGVGKTSLSYACARAGWIFTSDDGSFLLSDGDRPSVVGNCRHIRFRPSAAELFPELRGRDLTPRVQGKPSIEIPTSELQLVAAEQATIHSIVFLRREREGVAELLPLPRGTAIKRFTDFIEPIAEIRDRQMAILQQISEVAVYELRYSDLQSAIDCLDQLARGTKTIPV